MVDSIMSILQKSHENAATSDAKMFGVEVAIDPRAVSPERVDRRETDPRHEGME